MRNKNVHTISVYIYNVFRIVNPWRHNSDGANRRTKDLVTSYCGTWSPDTMAKDGGLWP